MAKNTGTAGETLVRLIMTANLLFQTAVIVAVGYSPIRIFCWISAVGCLVSILISYEKINENLRGNRES